VKSRGSNYKSAAAAVAARDAECSRPTTPLVSLRRNVQEE